MPFAGAPAQTAKDYARYSSYTAPRAQGQNVNGMHIFLFAGLKSHGPGAHDYPYLLDTWTQAADRAWRGGGWRASPSPARNSSTSPMW